MTDDTRARYWYEIDIWECPLCGHASEYRERKYTPKPAERFNRVHFHTETYHCGY